MGCCSSQEVKLPIKKDSSNLEKYFSFGDMTPKGETKTSIKSTDKMYDNIAEEYEEAERYNEEERRYDEEERRYEEEERPYEEGEKRYEEEERRCEEEEKHYKEEERHDKEEERHYKEEERNYEEEERHYKEEERNYEEEERLYEKNNAISSQPLIKTSTNSNSEINSLKNATKQSIVFSDDKRCAFNVGKYFDEKREIYYHVIFITDCELIWKQFVSYYHLSANKMSKHEFNKWCDTHQYPYTKLLYSRFLRYRELPCSRLLTGLKRKYNVGFYFSDTFSFKGSGPFRALVVFGKCSKNVDRSVNEYEQRVTNLSDRLRIITDSDHFCFPDTKFEMRPEVPNPLYMWNKLRQPIPNYEPKYPYNQNKPITFSLTNNTNNSNEIPRSLVYKIICHTIPVRSR